MVGRMASNEFKDKVALVTGASSGLGFAIASMYQAHGAQVVVTDIDESGAARWLEIDRRVVFLKHDVADESDWRQVANLISERFGQLDYLVNNAGVTLMGNVEEISVEDFDKTMAIDVRGPFLGCRTMIPLMKDAGGAIINIASVAGFKARPELVAYNTAKAGVTLMTQSIALHCAEKGYNIRVNSINPGVVNTDMLQKVIAQLDDDGALMDSYKAMHPIGRIGEADEIAGLVRYLSSENATFITGTGLTIDGGLGISV